MVHRASGVCVDTYSGTTGYEAAYTASELRVPEKQKGDFPEATAFERYAMKTSKKAN